MRTYAYRAGGGHWARLGRVRVPLLVDPRRGGQLLVPEGHPLTPLAWVVNVALDPAYGRALSEPIERGASGGLPEGPFVEPWTTAWRGTCSIHRWKRLTGLSMPAPINGAQRSDGRPTPAAVAGVGMPSRSGATQTIAIAGAPFWLEPHRCYLAVPYSLLRELLADLAALR